MTYESALADAWPSVVPVVQGELRRFRLPAEVADDLLQATAEVVLRKRPPFKEPDDLAPYARIVARRKALHWCRDTAKEAVGLPELPADHSVSEAARLRLLAAGTLRAYERLDDTQRDRLSRYLAGERATSSAERARERKRIERIRLQMAKAIERIAALGASWRRLLEVVGRPELVAAAAAALLQTIGGLFPPPTQASTSVAAGPSHAPALAVPSLDAPTPSPEPEPHRVAPVPTPPPTSVSHPAPAPQAAPPEPASDRTPVLRLESPTGNSNGINTRPNSPDKPLVCVRSSVEICIDKPLMP